MEILRLGKADNIINRSFYLQEDVVKVAGTLLGKIIVTRREGAITAGIITEAEAYAGEGDRASHAFGGRRTKRTEIMYRQGGTAYVYLCYGVHSLFNVVTNRDGIPHAVLIRGIQPIAGVEKMLERLNKTNLDKNGGIGPGNVTRLLGIHYSQTGTDLCTFESDDHEAGIWLEDHGIIPLSHEIEVTTRVGVDYAGEDAKLPYRFIFHHNKDSFPLPSQTYRK